MGMCAVVHARPMCLHRPALTRRRLVAAALLGMALGVSGQALAESAGIVFTLAPPPANLLSVGLTITANGLTVSDTDASTGSGMIEANLDVGFSPFDVTGLTFTGGRMFLSDMAFQLSYGFFGNINAVGTGISGFLP